MEKKKVGYNINLSNLKGLSDLIFPNVTQLHIVGMTKVVDGETVYIACNSFLDGGSEITI